MVSHISVSFFLLNFHDHFSLSFSMYVHTYIHTYNTCIHAYNEYMHTRIYMCTRTYIHIIPRYVCVRACMCTHTLSLSLSLSRSRIGPVSEETSVMRRFKRMARGAATLTRVSPETALCMPALGSITPDETSCLALGAWLIPWRNAAAGVMATLSQHLLVPGKGGGGGGGACSRKSLLS